MPRTVFDVPALKARQQDLEQLASQPDFWDDQKQAQAKMRQLDEVKAQLEQLSQCKHSRALPNRRWARNREEGRCPLSGRNQPPASHESR
mgnify:CR=1 FL=1